MLEYLSRISCKVDITDVDKLQLFTHAWLAHTRSLKSSDGRANNPRIAGKYSANTRARLPHAYYVLLPHAYYQRLLAENSGVSDQIAAALLSSTDFAIYNVMLLVHMVVELYTCVPHYLHVLFTHWHEFA